MDTKKVLFLLGGMELLLVIMHLADNFFLFLKQESQEVSAATEEQLASMQEIAASTTSLSFMAEELQESGKFRI